MGYVRYERNGEVRVGAARDGGVVPTPYLRLADALENGHTGVEGDVISDFKLLPAVDDGVKILCVALNFVNHAKESQQEIPETPLLFFKSKENLIAAGDDIEVPPSVTQLDYEGELAIIIGREAYCIDKEDAWDHIAGVTSFNDGSGRNLLNVKAGDKKHLDWFSAKCLERSTPVGPEVLPVSAILEDLKAGTTRVKTTVNGEVRQDAPVSDMIFSIPEIVAFASSRVRLSPGDIIATGTPPGVGFGDGRYLSPGDRVEIQITGLPNLINHVKK